MEGTARTERDLPVIFDLFLASNGKWCGSFVWWIDLERILRYIK